MTPKTFHAIPLPSPERITAADRAAIEISGLDQAGPSYEGRVFLNNPDAHIGTPLTPEQGYAGSFHVYGFGQEPEESLGFAPEADDAEPKARLPLKKTVLARDAVAAAAARGPQASVTIVPVLPGEKGSDSQKSLKAIPFGQVTIHTSPEEADSTQGV